jgi:hypothetical protein
MIVRLRTLWLAALLTVLAVPAQAHFVWVSVEPGGDGRPEARVWFAEDPSPGAEHLVSKIGHTKLHCGSGAAAAEVELKPVTGDGTGELVGNLASAEGPIQLEAICDYGTFGHGGPLMLLQYYAKALQPRTSAELAASASSEKLPLDIVPELADDGLRFTVLWQGKPVPKAEVSVLDIDGEDETLTTDEQGQVLHGKPGKGLISARAGHIESDRSGERNGKKYESVRHYTTLTLRLPADAKVAAVPAATTTAAAVPAPAGDLLAKAREARAVWNDFPGFTADVTLSIDGETTAGRLTVDEAGEVVLELPSSEGLKWARRQLASLVSHRMPGEPIGSGATLMAEAGEHPLGTLIKLEGESMGSVYRVDDNVVTEVSRDMASGRFTISVLDVQWNAEHKYLPTAFNVSYWEQPSGKLKSSQTNLHRWQRVGAFDLPTSLLEVEAADGGRHVRRLELRNLRLTGEPESTAAAARGVAK